MSSVVMSKGVTHTVQTAIHAEEGLRNFLFLIVTYLLKIYLLFI